MIKTFPVAAVAIVIVAAACAFSFRPIYEPDLWYHLAHGREDAAGRLVRANVFSFTYPDYRQHYTTWLFDVSVYAAWKIGGLGAIQALQAIALAAAFALVFVASRVRACGAAAVAVLLLGMFVIEPRAIPRPHVASFVGMAAIALLISRAVATRSARPLVWTIPIVALWSNVHVESVFGVGLVAIFAIGETVRPSSLPRRDAVRALGIAGGCLLATMANPYGWGLFRYLAENLAVPRMFDIAELQPPYLPAYRAFFLYAIVAAALLLSQPKRLALWEAITMGVFAIVGFRYLRLTPLLFLATAPVVASRLAAWIARGVDRRAVLVTAALAAVLSSRIPLDALATELRAGDAALEPPQFFSPAAIEFARAQGLKGPLFNSLNLGGYLAWKLYPNARIFQDARLHSYPSDHFARIRRASESQADWDALTAGVDWAVISRPRVNPLSGSGRFPADRWAAVYQDEAVEIVVRRDAYPKVVERYGR